MRKRSRTIYPFAGLLCLHAVIITASSSSILSATNKNRFSGIFLTKSLEKKEPQKQYPHFSSPFLRSIAPIQIRGGYENLETKETATENVNADADADTESFEEKVQAAMRKFGVKTTPDEKAESNSESNDINCEGGVCKAPEDSFTSESVKDDKLDEKDKDISESKEDVEEIAKRIAADFNIEESIALSALYASASMDSDSVQNFDESKAREIIEYEIDAIKKMGSVDSEEVKILTDEGFEAGMVKRALALTDMNIDDARAYLIAEREDEEAELEEQQRQQREATEKQEVAPIKTISVNSSFDPTAPTGDMRAPSLPTPSQTANTKPEIYQCTTAEVQKIILESPIPVLLDIYADWCGPCKQLTPALEQMCIKSNGLFRLVKVNADEEKGLVSSVLAVTGYPTLFGIRDGKIINKKVGGPQSEDEFRSFMVKIVSGHDETGEFEEMTSKLVKMAGSAALPFSQRERIQTMTQSNLSQLLSNDCNDDMIQAEKCVKMLRTVLSKVITEPYTLKFRKVNLSHPALQIVKNCPSSGRILKSVGFERSENIWMLKGEQKVINIAPLLVVRDCIDKWIDANRYEIAKAARKAKEDEDRKKLQLEMEEEEDEYDEEEEIEKIDPNLCTLKARLDGKKKTHEVECDGNDLVADVMDTLTNKLIGTDNEDDIEMICASKRLIVKSSDESMMKKSMKEIGIFPAASIVLKIIKPTVVDEGNETENNDEEEKVARKSSIAERAKAKKKKTGSHTMQSIGIYAKDDNAKGELIDGGGGVWYEHDVTDDEEEAEREGDEANDAEKDDEDTEKSVDDGAVESEDA